MNAKIISTYFFMIAGVILAGYFGPWWAPAAFVLLLTALMQMKVKQAVITGGLSSMVVFLAMAIWMRSMDEADIIGKTGMLMGGMSPVVMIAVTGVIGLISGILAGWTGSVLAEVFRKQ